MAVLLKAWTTVKAGSQMLFFWCNSRIMLTLYIVRCLCKCPDAKYVWVCYISVLPHQSR